MGGGKPQWLGEYKMSNRMRNFITTIGVFILCVAVLGVTFAMLAGSAAQIVVAAKSSKVQPGTLASR